MSSIFGQELVSGGLVQITQASVPTNQAYLAWEKTGIYIVDWMPEYIPMIRVYIREQVRA